MKNIIILLLISALYSCATGSPQNGVSTIGTPQLSPEAQARKVTEEMKTTLSLSAPQADKVLMINTVHLKILKKLKESNETEKIPATNENYKTQMKETLSGEQFSIFQTKY